MRFQIRLDVMGVAFTLAWSDVSPEPVSGNQEALAELGRYADARVERGQAVGPIPRGKKPDEWADPYSFWGLCEAYNDEFNPGAEMVVTGEMPPIDDLPPGAIY